MKFHIGQKVICVNEPTNHDERDRIVFKNRIYTVGDYVDDAYVVLREIKRRHNFSEDRFEKADILPEDLFTI